MSFRFCVMYQSIPTFTMIVRKFFVLTELSSFLMILHLRSLYSKVKNILLKELYESLRKQEINKSVKPGLNLSVKTKKVL